MGKKSRKPNRNKPKDIPAGASPAVAAPRQGITSATDAVLATFATFNQKCDSQDWAGALELESQMNDIANRLENFDPSSASSMYFNLGHAHKELGREGGIEEATLYFKKTIEFAKKGGDNPNLTKGLLSLCECYVKNGRIEEAMDLHKSRCDEIGKGRMDPDNILTFSEILMDNDEHSLSLTILEEHLENIDRSWGKQEQCRAYHMIAFFYCNKKNDFAKSNVYFERQLSIAKETNNVEAEVDALHRIGHNYERMGDYRKAMACLEQALVIDSERGDYRIGMTCTAMGDVLVAQEGREKEAILMFQKCVGLFEEGNASDKLMKVFLKLGNAYRSIRAWDDAIASLEKGLSIVDSIEDEKIANELKAEAKQSLGNTYVEKYESLPERNEELIRKALFFSETAAFDHQNSKGTVDPALVLDLAQEHYFLGHTEKAHLMLKKYLGESVRLGALYCQSCHELCAKDAIMEKCSVCKVARYCSFAHSIQAWNKGRLCHKVMCPWLKRWRKITEGEDATTELRDKLCNDFFERVLASKPT